MESEPTVFVELLAFAIVASLVASPVGVAYCVWKALFGKIDHPDDC